MECTSNKGLSNPSVLNEGVSTYYSLVWWAFGVSHWGVQCDIKTAAVPAILSFGTAEPHVNSIWSTDSHSVISIVSPQEEGLGVALAKFVFSSSFVQRIDALWCDIFTVSLSAAWEVVGMATLCFTSRINIHVFAVVLVWCSHCWGLPEAFLIHKLAHLCQAIILGILENFFTIWNSHIGVTGVIISGGFRNAS